MRTNLPVTAQEHVLGESDTLVSTTDLQSRITYANAAFIAISGFPEVELIGQPHNIVRHPDMPTAAFADLWKTVQAGRAWTALVKNRCRNGDYYWVRANVTPILERGQPVGYMSVRTRPSREEVAQAEMLYRDMREGRATGVSLREGVVLRGRMDRVKAALGSRPLATRLTLAAALPGAASVLGAALAADVMPLAGGAAGAVAGTLLAAGWLRAAVARPVREAAEAARQVAGGQIGRTLVTGRGDEIGHLLRGLNQLGVNVMALVSDVRQQVGGIETATAEIATGNQDLSDRTEKAAANLEETAASVEEIAGTIRNSTQHAQAAAELSMQASTVAREGGQVTERVVETMQAISEASARIGSIIGLVDKIAFQTNILALNAAVEAARAGDAGRGFAVVAAEVRSLSTQVAEASREIRALVEDSTKRVDGGSELARHAGGTLARAVEAAERVQTLVAEISSAATEQNRGIEQVNVAVAELDRVTQQNAALVEESAATAASLRDQATRLGQAVQVFRFGS